MTKKRIIGLVLAFSMLFSMPVKAEGGYGEYQRC